MNSGRLNSFYNNRLPIIKTANTRPNHVPRMQSMAPRGRFGSLNSTVHPKSPRPMDADFPPRSPSSADKQVSNKGDGYNVSVGQLLPLLQSERQDLTMNDMNTAPKQGEPTRIGQVTSRSHDDAAIDEPGSDGAVETDIGGSQLTSPTARNEAAYLPRSFGVGGESIHRSSQGDFQENIPPKTTQASPTSPELLMRRAASPSFVAPVSRNKIRGSAGKVQESLKNALDSVLVGRLRTSRAQEKAATPTNVTGSFRCPCIANQTEVSTHVDVEEGTFPSNLRRRLSKVADLVSRDGGPQFWSKAHKSYKSSAPTDPQLAASLDTMALNFAQDCQSYLRGASSSRIVAGKRHRDSDCAFRRNDNQTSSHVRGCRSAKESMTIQSGHCGRVEAETGMIQQKTNGVSLKASTGASSINSGNELDFLASIVLSQETEALKRKNYPDRHPTNETLVNRDGFGTQIGATGMQRGCTFRSVPGSKLRSAANFEGFGSSQIVSNRDDADSVRNEPQGYRFGQASQINNGTPGQEEIQDVPDIHHDYQLPEAVSMEEEPKSESSLTFEHTIVAEQAESTYAASHTTSPLPAEPSIQQIADEIGSSPFANSQKPECYSSGGRQAFPNDNSEDLRNQTEIGQSEENVSETIDETAPPLDLSLIPTCAAQEVIPTSSRATMTGPSGYAAKGSNGQEGSTQLPPFFQDTPAEITQDLANNLDIQRADGVTEDTEGKLAAKKHLDSQGSKAPNSTSKLAKPKRDMRGRRKERKPMDEDCSEITPAPPRQRKCGAYRAGPASQIISSTDGAGRSMQVTQPNLDEASGSKTPLPYTFCCEKCGATFNRRFNLNKHIRNVHHNIRKFECSLCDERFLQKSHRAAHLLAVHHKIRPFTCRICSKNFSWHGVLRKHLQAIHNVTIKSNAKTTRCTRPETVHQLCISSDQASSATTTQERPTGLTTTAMQTLCLAAKSAQVPYLNVAPENAGQTAPTSDQAIHFGNSSAVAAHHTATNENPNQTPEHIPPESNHRSMNPVE